MPGDTRVPPESFGNIFNPAYRNARQIHLDERFLNRRFTPAITLNDRRFKGLFAQLGHLQFDFASSRMERAFVTTSLSINTIGGVLITLRTAHLIRFSVQHGIESLFDLVIQLQALKGVALIVAVSVVSEVGDFNRFANPKQIMAYLGLIPGEHSSGGTTRNTEITKVGNKEGITLVVTP